MGQFKPFDIKGINLSNDSMNRVLVIEILVEFTIAALDRNSMRPFIW